MKNIYNQRVPVPRYKEIWDPQTVLSYLAGMAPGHTLLVILDAETCDADGFGPSSTWPDIKVPVTQQYDTRHGCIYTFVIDKVVKQSKPAARADPASGQV